MRGGGSILSPRLCLCLMNKSQLIETLAKFDMHPSRRMGQNFLIDPNMLSALVQDASVQAGERVLEIGPGLGVLTGALLDMGCDLTSVELDHRLAEYIKGLFGDRENFRLVQGDACKQDYDALMGTPPYRCVANLPYSCSTPFLSQISSAANPPKEICVLLQKEMADRLSAAHGTKDYGLPTVRIALRYNVRTLRTVPPEVFFPRPEVSSSFVKFELNGRCEDAALRKTVEAVAAAAFSQRRKKTAGLLKGAFPDVDAETMLRRVGLPPDVRADAISIDAYIALGREFFKARQ